MSSGPRLERLVKFFPDGVVLLDRSGSIQYMNPAAETLTETSMDEALNRHWKEVFSIRVDDPVRDQTGSLMEILLERPVLTTMSGKTIPIELQIAQVLDDSGNGVGSILVLHDVTDLNEEKEGLKESRGKYKRLVNSIEGIVWEAEGSIMRMRYVSDFAERLLGYSPKNWLNDSNFWKSIIHPEDRPSVLEIVGNALKQQEDYQIEYRVSTSDGRYLLVRDSVTVSVDRDTIRLSGVMRDITSSQQAREVLVKSEERFSAAFYANPFPLLLMNLEGRVLDVNEAFERMCGLFREQLMDRTLPETALCDAMQIEVLMRALQERSELAAVPFRIRSATGDDRQLTLSCRKIQLEGESCVIAQLIPE